MSRRPLGPTPYTEFPQEMSARLQAPEVNEFEHQVNWPRFKALLPLQAHRILDFGCGPGNFTQELAEKYPDAEIVGADAAEQLLPADSTHKRIAFRTWDGRSPLEDTEPFDLIIAKMSLQYINEADIRSVSKNLVDLLAEGGQIAYSVPHPADSYLFNESKHDEWGRRHEPGSYTREIGQTGLVATMTHRDMSSWMKVFWKKLPDCYTPVVDEIFDKGKPKRLNIAFMSGVDDGMMEAYARIDQLRPPSPDPQPIIRLEADSQLARELLLGDISDYPTTPLP